jgi:hypothetical protein
MLSSKSVASHLDFNNVFLLNNGKNTVDEKAPIIGPTILAKGIQDCNFSPKLMSVSALRNLLAWSLMVLNNFTFIK